MLYVAHAFLCGIAYVLTYAVQFNVPGPSAFGGPLLSWIFNGILNADKGSNWYWLVPLGIAYFAIYYFLFKALILRLGLRTPGREEDAAGEPKPVAAGFSASRDATVATKPTDAASDEQVVRDIVGAVGGGDNIENVEACFTRVRIMLRDPRLICRDDAYFRDMLHASGVVHVGDGVQIVYGNKASVYATEMREYLGME